MDQKRHLLFCFKDSPTTAHRNSNHQVKKQTFGVPDRLLDRQREQVLQYRIQVLGTSYCPHCELDNAKRNGAQNRFSPSSEVSVKISNIMLIKDQNICQNHDLSDLMNLS